MQQTSLIKFVGRNFEIKDSVAVFYCILVDGKCNRASINNSAQGDFAAADLSLMRTTPLSNSFCNDGEKVIEQTVLPFDEEINISFDKDNMHMSVNKPSIKPRAANGTALDD